MGRLRGSSSHRYPVNVNDPHYTVIKALLWGWKNHEHAFVKGCGQETLERWISLRPKTVDSEYNKFINCRRLRRGLIWLVKNDAATMICYDGCTKFHINIKKTVKLIEKLMF